MAFLWRAAVSPVGFPDLGFNDVSAGHPFYAAIAWAAANAITGGYADGGFHSLDDITRQAAAAFNERSDSFPL
jgi:hypothetical protein